MRSILCLLTSTVLLAFPARAWAQDARGGSCPPGAWFCDEAEPEDEDGLGDQADTDEAAPGEEGSQAPSATSPGRKGRPPVIVVSPGDEPPPKVIVLQKGTEAPPPPVTRQHRRYYREMGINLRLEGVMMGEGERSRPRNGGMGGLGMSFRYRPVPHFALDAGLDLLGGNDWYGDRRRETALLLSGIIFFNPFSPVQFYLIGGFGFSGAEVDVATTTTTGQNTTERRDYSYFGAHLGPGLEFRVGRRVALNVDLVGFIRGRTDDGAAVNPEFVDPDNPQRATNTSGGGLFRGGITFYW